MIKYKEFETLATIITCDFCGISVTSIREYWETIEALEKMGWQYFQENVYENGKFVNEIELHACPKVKCLQFLSKSEDDFKDDFNKKQEKRRIQAINELEEKRHRADGL